jgi:cytochrome c oxidase subunit 2
VISTGWWSWAEVAGLSQGRNVWMPEPASTSAGQTDTLFYFILYVSAFFFVLVVGLTILFAIKYRRRAEGQRTLPLEGNRRLEVAWSVVPALFFVVIFVWGFRDYIGLSVPPANALDVRVTAQKWVWSFDYPQDGISSSELVVPVGSPVRLTMSSMDVIHSFFVPAFRVKRDVLPNRYTVLWFEPTEIGTYDVLCTEYCGTGHSTMHALVKVVSETDYRAWVDSGGGLSGRGLSSAAFGKLLFQGKGCATCHSVDGSKKVGPSLLNKYGSKEQLSDGSSAAVDDNYLRESMVDPAAKVVQGFEPVMPTYAGRLKDKQLDALIDYLKSIGR